MHISYSNQSVNPATKGNKVTILAAQGYVASFLRSSSFTDWNMLEVGFMPLELATLF
jgi:hypothetical protein